MKRSWDEDNPVTVKKVLIIDDESSIREMIAIALGNGGLPNI